MKEQSLYLVFKELGQLLRFMSVHLIFSTGNTVDIDAAGSLHEFLSELHRAYGEIATFWIGQEQVVSTASPKLFKQQDALFDRPSK